MCKSSLMAFLWADRRKRQKNGSFKEFEDVREMRRRPFRYPSPAVNIPSGSISSDQKGVLMAL